MELPGLTPKQITLFGDLGSGDNDSNAVVVSAVIIVFCIVFRFVIYPEIYAETGQRYKMFWSLGLKAAITLL